MEQTLEAHRTAELPNLGFANNRHRRAENIAADLRNMIMNNTLAIGQKLPTETALCQQYDVSRTTLREAIQMLRSTGILDVTPGRGSYVRAPSLKGLLPTLQLVGRGKQFNPSDASILLHTLMAQSIGLAHSQLGHLQESSAELHAHTLAPNTSPNRCAEQEASWHLALLNLSNHALYPFMGQVLLPMLSEARREHYQRGGPDAIMRTLQLQLRTNAALAEGDAAIAIRLLNPQSHTEPPTQQAA